MIIVRDSLKQLRIPREQRLEETVAPETLCPFELWPSDLF